MWGDREGTKLDRRTMPTVSRFYGITVYMNYNDHEPAHFHARHEGQEVSVEIESGNVEGKMSRKPLQKVLEWSELHTEALRRNWELARSRQPLEPIPPLP
jgi:hypothetical protein